MAVGYKPPVPRKLCGARQNGSIRHSLRGAAESTEMRRSDRAEERAKYGLFLRRNQTVPDCVTHQAGDVVNVEPFHEAGAMRFNRLHTSVQQLRDLLGRFALGNQLQDFTLARRQKVERIGLTLGAIEI